jgi:hypothetical protein
MELAWFLSGLSHQSLSCPEKVAETKEIAVEAYRKIQKNQGKKGIFGRMTEKGFSRITRGDISNFADQIYPIYALTRYSQAYGDDRGIKSALDCA